MVRPRKYRTEEQRREALRQRNRRYYASHREAILARAAETGGRDTSLLLPLLKRPARPSSRKLTSKAQARYCRTLEEQPCPDLRSTIPTKSVAKRVQSYRKHYKLRRDVIKARQLKRLLHPQEVLLPRVMSA